MYDEFALTARQRGYKQSGKKLRPRFYYDADERDHFKHHSLRALRKARAIEGKAMAEAYGVEFGGVDAHWRKHHKAMDALSSRRRKFVEHALAATDPHSPVEAKLRFFGSAMRRAFDTAIAAEGIERCIDADNRMLANAY